MHHITRLLVNLSLNAIDLDVAIGCGLLRPGGVRRNAAQLGALGIGHQALASLSSHKVSSLLAAVGQVAAGVQTSKVAVYSRFHLVGLTGNIGLLGLRDIQAIGTSFQHVVRNPC